jgi:taurine dioxygenase
MRTRPGSARDPLTDQQRKQRPASVHPVFMVHPISGRTVLYCNPGYAIRINELAPAESDAVLQQLFDHQLQTEFRYVHTWSEGDLLMWDHIRTIHMAVADYGPHEYRLMKRCQVMADRVFDETFP